MNKDKAFYWLPRFLASVFIIFLSLFAFDSFGTGDVWYMQLLAFLIHLIPNFILLIALAIAWRYEKIGGWIFLLLYIVAIFFFRAEMIGLMLFSPLIIIGILFLYNSKINGKKILK